MPPVSAIRHVNVAMAGARAAPCLPAPFACIYFVVPAHGFHTSTSSKSRAESGESGESRAGKKLTL